MDELDKIMPDDFWRKAFEEVDETPPARVWNAIEDQLDRPKGAKVLPLWGIGLHASRPLVWGVSAAASVALVMIGWWLLHAPIHSGTGKMAHQAAAHTTVATRHLGWSKDRFKPLQSQQNLALAEPTLDDRSGFQTKHRVLGTATSRQLTNSLVKKGLVSAQQEHLAHRLVASAQQYSTRTIPALRATNRFAAAIRDDFSLTSEQTDQLVARTAFGPIASKPLRSARFGQIHRIVWYQPVDDFVSPEMTKPKRQNRDVWASASVMPSEFNPMISVQTASVVASNYAALDANRNNQFITSNAPQTVASRPNFSIAYQASAGMQVTDRWSVESGIGYLAGRSTVETPSQVAIASFANLSDRTGTTSTLFTDVVRNEALLNKVQAPSATTPATNANSYLNNQTAYYGQARQNLTNDYQFVQVPVQVGYQLRPRKRLSLALLGGLITNIFVRNTINDDVIVTAKDGIYRPVFLAATMGARFRYRPSRQWSASLAGMYQPALGTSTQANSQVQSHPTATGMSFGVDYHF